MTDYQYLINIDYMSHQKNITYKMRQILVDWLIEVATEYKLRQQSIHLAIILLDKYLSIDVIEMKELQCVGIVCLNLAQKYEEIYPEPIEEFVHISDKAYNSTEIVQMELRILNKLEYKLIYETPYQYLRYFKNKKNMSLKNYYFSVYLCLNMFMYTYYLAFCTT